MDYREYPEAVEWAEGALSDLLVSMEDDELIELHNRTKQFPTIYEMREFDSVAIELEMTPTELVDSLTPEFSTSDEWFVFGSDDKFYSFNSLDEIDSLEIPIYQIVKEILDSMNSYGNDEVADILDRMKEDWV